MGILAESSLFPARPDREDESDRAARLARRLQTLRAGLLALDFLHAPSRPTEVEQWHMREGKNIHHSGASASDSHRLPVVKTRIRRVMTGMTAARKVFAQP